MRAVQMSQTGDASVMYISHDVPQPVPADGEVLIRVCAAGINRPDIAQRKGLYPPPKGASPILGLEVAGEIVGGNPERAGYKLGDFVCALVPGGGYADYCVTPASHCLPIPSGWSLEEAASLPEVFFTVWINVFMRAGLKKSETLLIHGGSSGIGTAAIQLAKALDIDVLATVGSEIKQRAVMELGASLAINYKTQDFQQEVMSYTQDRGVDVILDMVGAPYFNKNLASLAVDGRLSMISLQKGAQVENALLSNILSKRLTITASTLRPRSVEFKAQVAAELRAHVWPLIEAKKIKPLIYKTFPLNSVVQAHELMESSEHIGKIVLGLSEKSTI